MADTHAHTHSANNSLACTVREWPDHRSSHPPTGSRKQHEPPKCGKDLVGWRCKITYPSGKTNERKWQDGFVFESKAKLESGTIVRAYRIFVLVDAGDEWVQDLPDDGICFRKPGLDETRASAEELRQAHRATSEV